MFLKESRGHFRLYSANQVGDPMQELEEVMLFELCSVVHHSASL